MFKIAMFGASCFRLIFYHHRLYRGGGYKNLSIPSSTPTANNINETEGLNDDLNVSINTTSSEVRASTTGASRVQVGEIYDVDSQTFDYTNLTILYAYLMGQRPDKKDSSGTGSYAWYLVKESASGFHGLTYCYNASYMCINGVFAGTYNGVPYVEAAGHAEVTVSFCGFVWQAVMLSQDIYGNTILTLWLDNVVQDKLTSYSSVSSRFSGCINGTIYAPMQKCIEADDYNDNGDQLHNNNDPGLYLQPLNFYLLGFYGFNFEIDPPTGSVYEGKKCYSGLSKYVAFPYQIPWQQNQSAKEVLGLTYNLSNEACASSVSDDGFYSSENNYANYADEDDGYQWWATNALWLPSLSEIGYEGKSGGFGVTEAQRSSNANNSGTVGSSFPAEIDNGVWTRSANYKQWYGYYFVKEGGSGKGVGALRAKVIRPAIHLNLTAIEAER